MRLTRLALATVAVAASFAGGSASALSAEPCPAGYQGVIIEHNGQQTSLCTNLASVQSCPSGDGVVITVSGRYVSVCLRQLIGQ